MFCAVGFVVCIGSGLGQIKAPTPLTILFRFEAAKSPVAFEEMQRELGTLLAPLGFAVNWHERSNTASSESFEDLVVVDLRGRCLMEAADLPSVRNSVLARTRVANGKVLPFSEVECDQVRALLHSPIWRTRDLQSDSVLGRALGRVLAHELYHILRQTTGHADQGIAKKSLSRAELVSEHLEFK